MIKSFLFEILKQKMNWIPMNKKKIQPLDQILYIYRRKTAAIFWKSTCISSLSFHFFYVSSTLKHISFLHSITSRGT